jgi:CBS domain-containing protein
MDIQSNCPRRPQLFKMEINAFIKELCESKSVENLIEFWLSQRNAILNSIGERNFYSGYPFDELHDEVIKQSVYWVVTGLKEEGRGEPPARYSFVWFGSGGRKELTIWSDQDHGLIYEVPDHHMEKAHIHGYFEEFSIRIVSLLTTLGYPICPGNVVACNSKWRTTPIEWKRKIDEWVSNSNWDNIRYCVILSDMRCLAGDSSLSDDVKKYLFDQIKEKRLINKMLNNTLHLKVTLGIWGQLITEPLGSGYGCVDIKYGGYLGLVKNIRLWAIEFGIQPSSTAGRIEAVAVKAGWDEGWCYELQEALTGFIGYRHMAFSKGDRGTSGRYLSLDGLSKNSIQQIKSYLKTVKRLQKLTVKQFST